MVIDFKRDNDEGEQSEFNPAMLKMKRFDKLQDSINAVNTNPLAFNDEVGLFNYELLFNLLNQLLQETRSKLGKKKKDLKKDEEDKSETMQGDRKRKLIEHLLKLRPIHVQTSHPNNPNKIHLEVNQEWWNIIRQELYEYESMIRGFLDKHGYDSPTKSEQDLF